ncbi:MAG: hypothetical protein QOG83_1680 [Alphaproteobacteria bacterium]|jgi:hypothetical protein|nr:hypothetical protein [Alphaproteobacteria bacterium]MEA2988969.1 hypothetical protein [Alphaproteobacteria bacterium]
MAQVIARCSLTGHYMFLGMDVDAEKFVSLPDPLARKLCPFCSTEHFWHKKDAKLVNRRPVVRNGAQRAL